MVSVGCCDVACVGYGGAGSGGKLLLTEWRRLSRSTHNKREEKREGEQSEGKERE